MPDSDADLTPEQEREVRRLLADARHDEPIPSEVADRLDRVLAELVRDRDSSDAEVAPVISLAAHRRRRVVLGLVAAAAVITVAGVGIRSLALEGGGSDSAATTGAAGAAAPNVPDDAGQDGGDTSKATTPMATAASAPPSGTPTVGDLPVPSAAPPAGGVEETGVPQLHATTWVQDVKDLLASGAADYATSGGATGSSAGASPGTSSDNGAGTTAESSQLRLPPACKAADFGAGTLLVVSYESTPAVLALRPPTGQSQVVELLQCGTAAVVRSVTLPR